MMEDVEISTIRGSVKASEMMSEITQKIDTGTIQAAQRNIGSVTKFIEDGNYDLIVFTGKSGFLSDRMLVNLDGVQKVWIEDQDQKYDDPQSIRFHLDELGIKPNECKLVVVDEHMSSGLFKARETLSGLSNVGLKDFAFASFSGPRRYNFNADLSYQEAVDEIVPSPEMSNRIFFPEEKDERLWEMLRGLEKLSDYYEQSEDVKHFIDSTVEKLTQEVDVLKPSQ
jgi:hypothetical protein